MMTRDAVLQGLLSLFDAPRYLEIGVNEGVTFHSVVAHRKVAVDPEFMFDVEVARSNNPSAEYHRVTSDEYFGAIVDPHERFDVVYLDGLHTAEQTLRDLLNALVFLEPNGIIVIDDVKPPSHLAAIPDHELFGQVRAFIGSRSKTWMGDVFRVVFFIDTFLQQFSYRTVAENHGQTVLWRKRRREVTGRTIAAAGAKSFEDLVLEFSVLRTAAFQEIVAMIRADRVG